jgi:hypothetical protein
MGTDDFSNLLQNRDSYPGRMSGKIAVLMACGRCSQPVVGVTIREMPGWCSVECKSCGHSSSLRYDH